MTFPRHGLETAKQSLLGSYGDGRTEILKQPLDQDSAEILVTGENISAPRLIADGSWALYSVSPDNAGPTTPVNLVRVPTSGATDGKGFFASSQSPQGVTLLHIDLEGNAQALWTQKGSFQTWGVPSPDGKSLAILGATIESNVWMIENF